MKEIMKKCYLCEEIRCLLYMAFRKGIKHSWLWVILMGCLPVRAQQLYVETRLAYEGDYTAQCGGNNSIDSYFRGQYLNLRFDANITPTLSFSYRQRLNKPTDATFFNATDWIQLHWQINNRWDVSGGKQVVMIGGYEYDRAPIDLYYCSEFWNQIACYQLGATIGYRLGANDKLSLQVCNTPFRQWAGNNKIALNAMWNGKHYFLSTIWSFNAIQNTNGWMSYIALGNQFQLGSKVQLNFDLMNRANYDHFSVGKDWSAITEVIVMPNQVIKCHGKYTYDSNNTGLQDDLLVTNGSKLHTASLGIEAHPLKNYRDELRLFAFSAYNWGLNSNASGIKKDGQLLFEAGVKWRLDMLKVIKQTIKNN